MSGLPGSAGHVDRKPNLLMRTLSRLDDGVMVRWVFRALLVGALGVLVLDLREMSEVNGFLPGTTDTPGQAVPLLPPLRDGAGIDQGDRTARDNITTSEDLLGQPMAFTLQTGGRLVMTGKIEQGAAQRFAEEIATRGEYVTSVELSSSGGALDDAMAMGRLIREKGYATTIPDGAICASACPLIFAGGENRSAGEKAAIGLHQFYAAGSGSEDAASALANAQVTTARISRFLGEMGVDPAVWLHALDTPPQALYYLSAEELREFGFVTTPGPVAVR